MIDNKKREFFNESTFKINHTNDTKDYVDLVDNTLFSKEELKKELKDMIILDTIENKDDEDILKSNLDLLQKVSGEKTNNVEELNLYGYLIEEINVLIHKMYLAYCIFYDRQEFEYSDMLVKIMNRINEIRK